MFYRSFVGAGLGVGLAEIPEGAAGLLLRRVVCLGQLLVLDIFLMWTTYWLVTILHTDCSHLPGGGLILPLRPWLGQRHLKLCFSLYLLGPVGGVLGFGVGRQASGLPVGALRSSPP